MTPLPPGSIVWMAHDLCTWAVVNRGAEIGLWPCPLYRKVLVWRPPIVMQRRRGNTIGMCEHGCLAMDGPVLFRRVAPVYRFPSAHSPVRVSIAHDTDAGRTGRIVVVAARRPQIFNEVVAGSDSCNYLSSCLPAYPALACCTVTEPISLSAYTWLPSCLQL